MRRVLKWLVRIAIVLVLLALAGCLLGFGLYVGSCRLRPAGALQGGDASGGNRPDGRRAPGGGRVKPAITIELRAEASGIVENVSVREGDRVTAGQELARLDSKPAQTALDQAEANMRQAELQDAATQLDLDEETYEVRKRVYERSKALFDQGLLPRDQLEQRELEFKNAGRAIERAHRNIESSQARIAQVKASVEQSRTQLLHTTIRAPFDAFVLRRQVEVGSGVAGVRQSASGGTILMTLGDARESSLVAKATAADARRLKVGQAARVRLDSDASQQLPGVVTSISTAGDVDPSTKLTTFPIVISLKAQPAGGWVNVPAQAEIVLAAMVDSIVVPEKCVRTIRPAARSSRVQTPAGNRSRVVDVGVVQKDRIQIRSGLDRGETVVCRFR